MSLRINNFDLLRLVAAGQVLIVHGVEHLMGGGGILYGLSFFPGVPIFFTISGFLISASYRRNPHAGQYAFNRSLRIYPALWMCLVISLGLAMGVGGIRPSLNELLPWLGAQLTLAQFYNPEFLRGFGVGVLNGSLWTISVELQFYLALPLIHRMIRGPSANAKLIVAIFFFAVLNAIYVSLRTSIVPESEMWQWVRFMGILLPTHLYLFLAGIFIESNFTKLATLLEGRGLLWLSTYVLIALVMISLGWSGVGNYLNPLLALMLAVVTISLAFTYPSLSGRFLRGNDVSYGIYIYHMPLMNCLLYLQFGGIAGVLVAVAGACFLGILSWLYLEKPLLQLKRNSLKSSIVQLDTTAKIY